MNRWKLCTLQHKMTGGWVEKERRVAQPPPANYFHQFANAKVKAYMSWNGCFGLWQNDVFQREG
jgi:hypothetical protein